MGMKIKTSKKMCSVEQKSRVAPEIGSNTKTRAASTHPSKNDFHKMLGTSIYEKTMDNVRKKN